MKKLPRGQWMKVRLQGEISEEEMLSHLQRCGFNLTADCLDARYSPRYDSTGFLISFPVDELARFISSVSADFDGQPLNFIAWLGQPKKPLTPEAA